MVLYGYTSYVSDEGKIGKTVDSLGEASCLLKLPSSKVTYKSMNMGPLPLSQDHLSISWSSFADLPEDHSSTCYHQKTW
jgi:hypothetical protein